LRNNRRKFVGANFNARAVAGIVLKGREHDLKGDRKLSARIRPMAERSCLGSRSRNDRRLGRFHSPGPPLLLKYHLANKE
jgi:hypothetical protein